MAYDVFDFTVSFEHIFTADKTGETSLIQSEMLNKLVLPEIIPVP